MGVGGESVTVERWNQRGGTIREEGGPKGREDQREGRTKKEGGPKAGEAVKEGVRGIIRTEE